MHVASMAVELHLPGCHSLKDKRAVVRPVLDGSRRRFLVAAAEVDHQDRWQHAVLGFAAVAATAGHVTEVLDAVERWVWSFPEVEVLECRRAWLDMSEEV